MKGCTPMILEVQHETRFEYSTAVQDATIELRMEPANNPEQACHTFHLDISPSAELFRYQDGFGNRVHHFNVLGAYNRLRILAAAVIETQPPETRMSSGHAVYPLELGDAGLDVLDYLPLRGPVRPTPRLAPLLEALAPRQGMPVAELVVAVGHYIHEHYEYARDVTLSSSPIDDLLAQGKGVCQDFTHLMIAVLRSFGVPARYVSGYLHRENKQSQSHAWCEAWLPDLGWVGFDPTNDCPANERFVKIAVGRNFTDVPPNKGVYRGRAEESISVRVETRVLHRLPSLSWQEQLPPLHIPLTAIVLAPRAPVVAIDDESPQQ